MPSAVGIFWLLSNTERLRFVRTIVNLRRELHDALEFLSATRV